jgi:hypothetical protein
LLTPLFPVPVKRVRIILRKVGERALKKRVHPHLLRHTSATYWANKLPYFKFCKRFGWTLTSKMPQRYIDREGLDDVDVARIYLGSSAQQSERSTPQSPTGRPVIAASHGGVMTSEEELWGEPPEGTEERGDREDGRHHQLEDEAVEEYDVTPELPARYQHREAPPASLLPDQGARPRSGATRPALTDQLDPRQNRQAPARPSDGPQDRRWTMHTQDVRALEELGRQLLQQAAALRQTNQRNDPDSTATENHAGDAIPLPRAWAPLRPPVASGVTQRGRR